MSDMKIEDRGLELAWVGWLISAHFSPLLDASALGIQRQERCQEG